MDLLQLEALVKMAYKLGSNSFQLLTAIFDFKYQDLSCFDRQYIVDYIKDEYLVTVHFNGFVYYCEIFVCGSIIKSFCFSAKNPSVYSTRYDEYIAA